MYWGPKDEINVRKIEVATKLHTVVSRIKDLASFLIVRSPSLLLNDLSQW
jgi:hypothetical protein